MVLETVAVVTSVLIAAEILVGLVMNYLDPYKDPNRKNTLLNSYVYEQPITREQIRNNICNSNF